MPMVRAMRMLNAVEAGTLTGAQLQTLLTADPGRLAELNVLLGMRGQARRMAASSTAMNAVAASSTAMAAVIASSTAMAAVAASSTAMAAVAASSTAMAAMNASDTAMNALYASPLATKVNYSSAQVWSSIVTLRSGITLFVRLTTKAGVGGWSDGNTTNEWMVFDGAQVNYAERNANPYNHTASTSSPRLPMRRCASSLQIRPYQACEITYIALTA